MNIVLIILFFILGFILRDIVKYILYVINTINEAEKIIEKENKRKEFKKKRI